MMNKTNTLDYTINSNFVEMSILAKNNFEEMYIMVINNIEEMYI